MGVADRTQIFANKYYIVFVPKDFKHILLVLIIYKIIKESAVNTALSFLWCTRQELNLHGVNHKILSLARLPIPPRVLI